MRKFFAILVSSTLVLQAAPLVAASAAPAGAQAQVATGAINGTAQSASGQTLPHFTVQLRNLERGQITGSTTSNAAGGFSFPGLAPANYVVEVVNSSGAIVGSSASIGVTAGSTATVAVATSAIATAAGAAGAAAAAGTAAGVGAAAGISTAVIVTTVAVAAGIAGVVVATRPNASPSR